MDVLTKNVYQRRVSSFIFFYFHRSFGKERYAHMQGLPNIVVHRELIQLAVSVKRYISSPENGLEMVMISLVLWILTQNTEENVSHSLVNHRIVCIVVPAF